MSNYTYSHTYFIWIWLNILQIYYILNLNLKLTKLTKLKTFKDGFVHDCNCTGGLTELVRELIVIILKKFHMIKDEYQQSTEMLLLLLVLLLLFFAFVFFWGWGLFSFIYLTITKHITQLILIMLVGSNVCVCVILLWEKTGVPGWNPNVWLGDHMTISHADARYWTQVATVRGQQVATATASQKFWSTSRIIIEHKLT